MSQFRFLIPAVLVVGALASTAQAGSDPVLANGYTVQVQIEHHGNQYWKTVYSSYDFDDASFVELMWELAIKFDLADDVLADMYLEDGYHYHGTATDVRMIYAKLPIDARETLKPTYSK